MTLKLDLPTDLDGRLQRDAERRCMAKEALAIDILARSLEASDFWTPLSFEALAKAQGVKPISDVRSWLDSLPDVEGADELVEQVEATRCSNR